MPWWGWLLVAALVACAVGLVVLLIWFLHELAKGFNW